MHHVWVKPGRKIPAQNIRRFFRYVKHFSCEGVYYSPTTLRLIGRVKVRVKDLPEIYKILS